MSVRATWTVFCEADVPPPEPTYKFPFTCGDWIGQEDTADEARKVARRAGWQLRPKAQGGDRCPVHKDL